MRHYCSKPKLQITVHEARGLKGGGLLRSLTPYCIVQVGSSKYQATAVKGGGHPHRFEHTYTFRLRDGVEKISVTLLDKEGKEADGLLGYGELSLHDLDGDGKYHGEIPLRRKSGKSGGSVRVTIKLKNSHRSKSPIGGSGCHRGSSSRRSSRSGASTTRRSRSRRRQGHVHRSSSRLPFLSPFSSSRASSSARRRSRSSRRCKRCEVPLCSECQQRITTSHGIGAFPSVIVSRRGRTTDRHFERPESPPIPTTAPCCSSRHTAYFNS